jgi:hypothetical protein
VLSAHQGGGEPLRSMPLEITRCLRVPGAELTSPPPPVRHGPGCVEAVDTPWPNGQTCHSCGRRHLVPASDCRRVLPLACSRAPAWVPPRALRGLPRLCPPIEGKDSPFFPSPWQDSHCSRVRCNFLPMVIGPERGCGSSPSMTLKRPIASSINIVERSSRDSIE